MIVVQKLVLQKMMDFSISFLRSTSLLDRFNSTLFRDSSLFFVGLVIGIPDLAFHIFLILTLLKLFIHFRHFLFLSFQTTTVSTKI